MSGSNKSTTTTSNAAPTWAKPGLTWAGNQATDLAKAGNLAKPLTMSTVVPFSQQTTQGMNSILGNASAGMAPGGVASQFGDIIGNGGFNQPQQDALSGIRATATSDFDINANPGFASVLKQAQDGATNAVNQNAAAMGRYCGGAHQGVLAQELGDLTGRMVSDEYRHHTGRQDSAQDRLFNAGQTGQGNLSNAFEQQMAPANAMMGVGGMYEDLYGRQLNDQLRIADETVNQPRNNLRELMALLGGSGQFGTSTSTAQGPSNTFSNIMGGLLGAGSLLRL